MSKLRKFFRPRNLLIVALVGLLVVAVFAFAAANVVPESGAGDGTGTVSGYTISAIDWDIQAADPELLDNVTFTVTPTGGASAATEVYATVDGGTTWITCTGGPSWACDFTASDPTVASVVNLQVVAIE